MNPDTILNETLVQLASTSAGFLKRATADIPADVYSRAHPSLPNHPAWIVGHLTFTRAGVAAMLGHPGPVLPDPRYSAGSVPSTDPAAYPHAERLLADFHAAQTHLAEVIKTLTPDQLSAPTPNDNLRPMFPRVRDMLLGMFSLHDGLHLGQLTDWRRAQGLPRLIV